MSVSDLTDEEQAWSGGHDAVHSFAETCASLRDRDPYPNLVPLDHMINFFMTELWDRGFSQTEIRSAFTSALADMNRYAAGEESRS